MPITGTLAIIASASMAGVPLLNGFLSKEMFFAETVFIQATPWVNWSLPVIATLAGIFSVAYSARFVFDVFFGPPCGADVPKQPHEPPHWMRVPVELLVLICLVVGVAPAWSVGAFLAAAATPVVGGVLPEYSLAAVARLQPAAPDELRRAGRRRGALPAAAARPRARRRSNTRRCCTASTASACSRTCSRGSAKPAGAAGACSARGACRCSCCCWSWWRVAGAAASLWLTPAARGTRELLPFSPMFAMTWVIGGVCARGGRLAGQVPPAGVADAGLGRGAGVLHHLHLVLGARPRAHAAGGRDGDHGADPARPALAADAHRQAAARRARGCGSGAGAGATC